MSVSKSFTKVQKTIISQYEVAEIERLNKHVLPKIQNDNPCLSNYFLVRKSNMADNPFMYIDLQCILMDSLRQYAEDDSDNPVTHYKSRQIATDTYTALLTYHNLQLPFWTKMATIVNHQSTEHNMTTEQFVESKKLIYPIIKIAMPSRKDNENMIHLNFFIERFCQRTLDALVLGNGLDSSILEFCPTINALTDLQKAVTNYKKKEFDIIYS